MKLVVGVVLVTAVADTLATTRGFTTVDTKRPPVLRGIRVIKVTSCPRFYFSLKAELHDGDWKLG
jgi:hypothetical protein